MSGFAAMTASSVDSVIQSITEAVRMGRLVPGQRLVEAEFTRNMGVSRGTVREAFARLVSDGLLNFERHRGVTVRLMTRKQVDDLFDVRASLEGLAVRLAVPRLNADPERMLDLMDKLNAAEEEKNLSDFSKYNKEFHKLFRVGADNDLLAEMNEKFASSVYGLQFRVMMDVSRVLATNQDHRDVVQAVIDNNADAAEAAMRRHIEGARVMVQELPDDFFKTD